MKNLLGKVLKSLTLMLLIISFIVFVAVGIFVWKYPQVAIDIISRLKVEEVEVENIAIKGIAVIGDSQSDEYRADDGRGGEFSQNTFNWVEQLAKFRNINFGKWDTYNEPRRTGYAYNFSRTGATVNSMLESGQDTGVVDLVKSGDVNLVIIYIGANDFSPYITNDGYQQIYDGSLTDKQILRKSNSIVAGIVTAIEQIEKAGDTKIILVLLPDWGNHMGIQIAFPIPDQRNRVTTVITSINEKLKVIALEKGIPVIDPNKIYLDSRNNGMNIGSITMEHYIFNNNPKSIFLDDAIHTGTVMNSLFANKIIETLNGSYGANIAKFSDDEILEIANIREGN